MLQTAYFLFMQRSLTTVNHSRRASSFKTLKIYRKIHQSLSCINHSLINEQHRRFNESLYLLVNIHKYVYAHGYVYTSLCIRAYILLHMYLYISFIFLHFDDCPCFYYIHILNKTVYMYM